MTGLKSFSSSQLLTLQNWKSSYFLSLFDFGSLMFSTMGQVADRNFASYVCPFSSENR